MLGDGVMKMEKMKIDMALEIERMRMESEMKRNQLILESQKQIVDAFVKVGMADSMNESEAEYDGSVEWHWWMTVMSSFLMSSLDGGRSGG
ncbi:hypothetical protein Tco_1277990 [Tanacetum coccineum]